MLRGLGQLIGRKDREATADRLESFGKATIARRLGEEVLRATPERRNHLQGIRDRLSSLQLEEKDELVDRLFSRVALFVHDLPASQANHHSGRFGLLDHLLEVSFHTVRELSTPGFQVSPEPSTNHRERPLWVYAGLVGAIAHDIGKPLDLEVVLPGNGTPWNPRIEPLRLFVLRNGLFATGPELWHFRPGRGLRGHEKGITELLPIILTSEITGYLGPRLESVALAMTEDEEWKPVGGRRHPAQEVVAAIRRMDQRTAKDARDGESRRTGGIPRDPCPLAIAPGFQSPPSAPGVAAERGEPSRARNPGEVPSPGEPRILSLPRAMEVLEEPLILPPDFWVEPVPSPRSRRGDPVEIERRLQAELDPTRFMETLRRMVVARRLSRNNLYTEVYIRPDYVWVMLPGALRRTARINRLPFDTEVLSRMLASFRVSPQVAPGSDRRVPVFVRPRPDSSTLEAVRVRTKGFLSESDLKSLGVYEYDLKALDPQAFLASELRG